MPHTKSLIEKYKELVDKFKELNNSQVDIIMLFENGITLIEMPNSLYNKRDKIRQEVKDISSELSLLQKQGEKQPIVKKYICTDCKTANYLEDNGEITVGYCSRCGHPLWNPPQNHDATPFVNKEAYMIKRERVVEIVNVLKYKIKSGAYTPESLCDNLDTFRDEITALPKYAQSHQVEMPGDEEMANKLYNWSDPRIEGDITLQDCYKLIEWFKSQIK